MEQLVILIIIALISFVNWAMQKSAERREARKLAKESGQEAAPSATPARPASSAEAEMRKFMDALGLPVEEPPAPPRAEVLEPTPVRPPPIPSQRSAASRITRPDPEMRRLAQRLRESESPYALDTGVEAKREFRNILTSPNSLREAMILREVLGPPKALQD